VFPRAFFFFKEGRFPNRPCLGSRASMRDGYFLPGFAAFKVGGGLEGAAP
jgi:hypothetical protein